MSEQQITLVIQNILGQDNAVRQTCESELQNSKQTHPNELFSVITTLLKTSPLTEVRSFCAVFLRKNLSSFSEKSFDNQIKLLNPQVILQIQSLLFQSLESEQDSLVRHQVCDAIGEIGGTFFEMKIQWPNLIQNIFSLLQQNNLLLIDSGFRILAAIFEFESEEFMKYQNELFSVFQNGIQCEDCEINNSAILALGQLIMVIEPKSSKLYEQLLPSLLQSSLKLLKKDQDKYGEDVLSTLADIAEAEPKFFKAKFDLVFQFVHQISNDKDIDDFSLKEIAINFIITIVERVPSLVKKDKEKLKGIVSVDKEIEEEWKCPKEGFKDELENGEVENDEIHFGMQGVDRLISSIGQKILLPILGTVVQEMIVQEDWRYKNAAIMALSQVGEYIEDVQEVKPICDLVLNFSQNSNPRIRYAVCHFMGQISDDMQPKIQEIYYEKVFDQMFKLLSDPVPRVIGHAAACLSNFVEGMTEQGLEPYLLTFMKRFFEILQNSCSFVKESVITAISSFADTAKKSFLPYYNDAVNFLFNMMEMHQQKEYSAIRGLIIECMTLMGNSVEYENFKQYAEKTIQMMLIIQNSPIDPSDSIKSYLLSGWQRICIIMGKNFQPYLGLIIPSTYALLKNVFVTQEGAGATQNIQTYDTEEATIAINMLSVIIDEMSEHMIEYIQPTLSIIVPLCNYATNGDIRSSSVHCLSGLVKATNIKDQSAAQNLCRNFIEILWQASENECFADIIKDQIYAMKDCLEIIGQKFTYIIIRFLSELEIQNLSDKIFKHMQESQNRKTENDKLKKETEDLEEEDIQEIDEGNLEEDNLYVALGELMGTLFKTHKELTLKMVDQLYNSVLSGALQPNQSDVMHKFGIFVIDDMIEFLGIELQLIQINNRIPDKWPHLLEALLRFCCDKSCQVRQAAAYGIGVLSEKSSQVFANLAPVCIKRLFEALEVTQGTEKPKVFGHCKDNIVSALGKIIKTNLLSENDLKTVISKWFQQLPLKHDKPEAIFNHELLSDIMINKQQLILQDNIQNAFQVIRVYGQIIQTKYSDDKINQKITINLKQLASYPEIQSQWNTIIADLDQKQKEKLEKSIKSV